MLLSTAVNSSSRGKPFGTPPTVGSQSPLCSIATYPLPCGGVTPKAPKLTYSVVRPWAVGLIPQPMAWSLFPCGREDAQSLHLQSCAPGAHLQASPPAHAEGYGIRCPYRAALGPIYLPAPFLFIAWKAHRWERTS